MKKLYIFGIGGTGSRVIKSLTMLLASGLKTKFEIVPILIDPDSAGGDLNRTIKLLRNYQRIQETIRGKERISFFNNAITTLGDIVTEQGGRVAVFHGFNFELEGVKTDKFKDFIDFNTLDQANKNLARLLFSEDNLDASLEVGFKGNPNIGSVVLNQLTKSKIFETFASNYKPDDRIFIVGSIFGGTGAAGFPLILKNLRKGVFGGEHYKHLKEAKIGAITVLPYFNVEKDANSEINSHGFLTKTKAALNYYAKNITGNKSINALYYIGDKQEKEYKNAEGGTQQKNDAHFIEVASALSIIDFANTPNHDLETNNGQAISPLYKEFGIKGFSNLSFNDFYNKTENSLKNPLIQYFYFNLFLRDKMGWAVSKAHAFAREYSPIIDKSFLQGSFYRTLLEFNKSYRIWLAELSRNQISFSPFSIKPRVNSKNEITDFNIESESIFTLVNNVPEKKGLNPFAQNNFELIITHLNDAAKKVNNASSAPKRFMRVFFRGTASLINQKLK